MGPERIDVALQKNLWRIGTAACLTAVTLAPAVAQDLGGASISPTRVRGNSIRVKTQDRGTYQPAAATPVNIRELTQPVAKIEPQPPRLVSVSRQVPPGAQDAQVEPVNWDQTVIYADDVGGRDHCGGCDSAGCDGCGRYGMTVAEDLGRCGIRIEPGRWFGRLELLLLFRKETFVPALLTTGPVDAGGDAGELGVTGTEVLFGGQNVLDDMTVGGRVTIGTWIDDCRDRAVVGRLWAALEADDSASPGNDVLAIPFIDATGASDVNLVNFPDTDANFGRFGSASVDLTSNVYGGDVSIRQFWTGGLGTQWDVLYGYQYMGVEEDLRIRSASTLTQAEVGNSLRVRDEFDVNNQFHGGQVGINGGFRQGCWSFNLLTKIAGGGLQRTVQRRGVQTISTAAGDSNTIESGLFVTDANAGTIVDSTFAWVPEIDLSLGWRRYDRLDLTIGYNLIALTDTVQLEGVFSSQTNPNFPASGPALPDPRFGAETYYVQSLQFGAVMEF